MPEGSAQRLSLMSLPIRLLVAAFLVGCAPAALADDDDDDDRRGMAFQRIATFPVFLNNDLDDEIAAAADPASAEIVASSTDGTLLVYTDSGEERIGFVNISDPHDPQPDGLLDMDGEPTSVATLRGLALVAVNTSTDFINTSGELRVVDLGTRTVVRSISLGGQPDAIAVSPNGRYAAVAIENERDEDLGDGRPPQDPPGFLIIVDLVGEVDDWTTRRVDFVDVPGLVFKFPTDPEPEFVSINARNVVAVTLQENNHVILVGLSDGTILNDWPAGEVDLRKIDTLENDLIEPKDSLDGVPREPDGIAVIGTGLFGTADEGDLDGGSRGFTIFDKKGRIKFAAGNSVERLVTRIGHYPENRSENKGNEPEGILFARYGGAGFLFVGSERSSVVLVYELKGKGAKPRFRQTLPAGIGPEGLLAIPDRDLFVISSEVEDLEDGLKARSSITLYELVDGTPTYPTVVSADRRDGHYDDDDDDDGDYERGSPIPWGALSALAADRHDPHTAYTAYDSFYRKSRLFVLDVGDKPARITDEIVLRGNGGATVDLDLEGLATRKDGSFWVVSEGSGSAGDSDRTFNLLLKVARNGQIREEIRLPEAVNDLQRRFGFEGVAVTDSGPDELVYVAFQREWDDDPDGQVRIGRYDPNAPEDEAWTFFYYPLDAPESQTPIGSSWVGLSEVVALDDDTLALLERDNQAGTSAAIKRIYLASIAGVTPRPEGEDFPLLDKKFVRDLIPDLTADNGPVIEKVEGLTVLADGEAVVVTDNDGVDDSSGETQFLHLGDIFGLGKDRDDDEDD